MNTLTTHQVAEKLGVSLLTVYKYIYNGDLRASKLGKFTKRKHWRINEADLDNFIAGNGASKTGDTIEKVVDRSEQSLAPSS